MILWQTNEQESKDSLVMRERMGILDGSVQKQENKVNHMEKQKQKQKQKHFFFFFWVEYSDGRGV